MRTDLMSDPSSTLVHARTPGVILLARDIKDVVRRCRALIGKHSAARTGFAAVIPESRLPNSEVKDSETIHDEPEQL